jgi:hypothetical protein
MILAIMVFLGYLLEYFPVIIYKVVKKRESTISKQVASTFMNRIKGT